MISCRHDRDRPCTDPFWAKSMMARRVLQLSLLHQPQPQRRRRYFQSPFVSSSTMTHSNSSFWRGLSPWCGIHFCIWCKVEMNLRLAGILDNGQWDNGVTERSRRAAQYRRKTKEMRQNDDVR